MEDAEWDVAAAMAQWTDDGNTLVKSPSGAGAGLAKAGGAGAGAGAGTTGGGGAQA